MACAHCGSRKHYTAGHPRKQGAYRGEGRLNAVRIEDTHHHETKGALRQAHERQGEILGFLESNLGKLSKKKVSRASHVDSIHI